MNDWKPIFTKLIADAERSPDGAPLILTPDVRAALTEAHAELIALWRERDNRRRQLQINGSKGGRPRKPESELSEAARVKRAERARLAQEK